LIVYIDSDEFFLIYMRSFLLKSIILHCISHVTFQDREEKEGVFYKLKIVCNQALSFSNNVHYWPI